MKLVMTPAMKAAGTALLLIPALLSPPAMAATKAGPKPKPICFMSGELGEKDKVTSGFGSVGNAVRLRFDAVTVDECRTEVEAWCRIEVMSKRRQIKVLSAYFRDGDQETRFTFEANCFVQSSPAKVE